jgi:predicted phosphodiesterase
VTFGENVSSPVYQFTTLDRQKEAVSFVVLNDIHGHKEELSQMLKAAKEKPYDLVFLNGDIINNPKNEQQVIDIIQACNKTFAESIPMVYVRGNHDARGVFARQLPEYFTVLDNRYYGSFDHGPIHFVVMDSGEDKEDSHKEYCGLVDFEQYRNEERLWLEKEIQNEAFQKAAFRVVLMHIPVDVGPKVDFAWMHRQKWMPLFEKGKVDVMFCGHTHQPEIVPPEPGEHSYPIVIGGGPLKMERPQSWDYTTIRVDGTPNELKITIVGYDGKIIDSCTLAKKRK